MGFTGILLALGLLLDQWLFCLDMWENDYKAQAFDTLFQYFFSVSKGVLLISLTMILISIIVGFTGIRRKLEKR